MTIGIIAVLIALVTGGAAIIIPRLISRRNNPEDDTDSRAYMAETGRSAEDIVRGNQGQQSRPQTPDHGGRDDAGAPEPPGPQERRLRSECADCAYDSPSEGSLPAAVGVEQEPGQFPVSVLGVVGQDPLRGIPCRTSRQVHDKVGILRHRSYCA